MNKLTNVALIGVVILSSPVLLGAQGKDLAKAVLVEEQEHDVQAALTLYRKIAGDPTQSAADRVSAQFRLGRILLRLGKVEEGRAFLTAASKGDGAVAKAAGSLLADGGSDAEQVRELRARATKILNSWAKDPGKNNLTLGQKLRWIGTPSVLEIIDQFEFVAKVRGVPSVIWQVGGEAAREFIEAALAKEDPGDLKALAYSYPQDASVGLHDLAIKVMQDERAGPGARLGLASNFKLRVPLTAMDPLLNSKDLDVVSGIWQILQKPADLLQTKYLEGLVARLPAAFDRGEPRISEVAHEFLRRTGCKSTRGTEMILQQLHKWPKNRKPDSFSKVSVGAVLAAATLVGPRNDSDLRTEWLVVVAEAAVAETGVAKQPEVFEEVLGLVRLGYLSNSGWFKASGVADDPERMSVVIRALPDDPIQVSMVLRAARPLVLPADLAPVLIRAWSAVWGKDALVRGIAATGSMEGVQFLGRLVRGSKNLSMVAHSCGVLLQRTKHASAPVAKRRREVLATVAGWVPRFRDTSWELGLRALLDVGAVEAGPICLAKPDAAWPHVTEKLYERWSSVTQARVATHSYTDADYAALWRQLLGDKKFWAADLMVVDRESEPLPSPRLSRFSRCHPRAPIVEQLILEARRLGKQSKGSLSGAQEGCLFQLLALPRSWVAPEPKLVAELRKLRLEFLRGSFGPFHTLALESLGADDCTAAEMKEVLRFGRSANARLAGLALEVCNRGVKLPAGDLKGVLLDRTSRFGVKLIESGYLERWTGRLDSSFWISLLAHPVVKLRAEAAIQLGRSGDLAGAQALIECLQDPSPLAREAATNALRAIRFYQEQQRAFGGAPAVQGSDVLRDLLRRTRREEKKEWRLVAITSLGLLGKIEAVPGLIKLGQDADSEIAAAARKAIADIHRRAAPPK